MSPSMGKRTSKRTEPGEVRARLGTVAEAFDREDWPQALAGADALLAEDDTLLEALLWRARALTELDRLDDALETYARAVKLAPDEPELLLSAVECLVGRTGEDREAVEDGLALCSRGQKLARHAGDVELLYEFLLWEGIGFNQVGECTRALGSLDAALEQMPRSVEARLERAVALFELCRFVEADAAFAEVLAEAPDEPWAYHYRGLLAERRGEAAGALGHFTRARTLAPEEFPPPVELGEEAFDRAVEAAMKALPGHVKEYLENVTLAVEEIPKDEDLMGESPPLSPCILGVFRGSPVVERHSILGGFDPYPPSIVLYQKNLERFARTREELVEQIGITVMHEVGHLMGLDEEDLWERGLD